MLLKCQKAAVRRKLRDRNPELFSAFEIFDHARHPHSCFEASSSALVGDWNLLALGVYIVDHRLREPHAKSIQVLRQIEVLYFVIFIFRELIEVLKAVVISIIIPRLSIWSGPLKSIAEPIVNLLRIFTQVVKANTCSTDVNGPCIPQMLD
jgi:hypothetical protein